MTPGPRIPHWAGEGFDRRQHLLRRRPGYGLALPRDTGVRDIRMWVLGLLPTRWVNSTVLQSRRAFDRLHRLLWFGKDLDTENAKFAKNVGGVGCHLRGLSELHVKVFRDYASGEESSVGDRDAGCRQSQESMPLSDPYASPLLTSHTIHPLDREMSLGIEWQPRGRRLGEARLDPVAVCGSTLF